MKSLEIYIYMYVIHFIESNFFFKIKLFQT